MSSKKMSYLRKAILFTIPRIINQTNPSSSVAPSKQLYRPLATSFARLYSNENSPSIHIDLSNEENKRQLFNRLIYRSKQRGYLELDLILGSWVEANIDSMDENTIKSLIHVLDVENPDLWKWLTGQDQPLEAMSKNPVYIALHEKVMNNLNSHSAPETRATPGQPWVRGWDDFKKGRDGPVVGNQ